MMTRTWNTAVVKHIILVVFLLMSIMWNRTIFAFCEDY
jgi:hypothetical protein